MTAPHIRQRVLLVAVGLIALGFASWLYWDYLRDPGSLWRDLYHDRNTHLSRGMALALDSRDLNPLAYLLDATAIVVWPPLHAIFLSVVMSVFGVNSALGLVPGLCGWILMTLCVWQISQKVSDGEAAGIVAGSVALIFTVASPALRLLSADVMLEGLGAGLSAANLLIFIYLSKYPSRKYLARLLALGLTLLFFTKFNYWLILVFSLLISCASGIRIGDILSSSNRAAILSVARSFLRNPVTLLAVVLFAIMLGLAASGPTSLDLFGRTLVFRASQWVVIPYGLLVVSACHAWRKNRDVLERSLPEIAVTILGWHAVPVLLWFLVPEAITSFVWFVGPTHWGAQAHYNPASALQFQWWGFAHGFHVAPWSAALALALALPGGISLFSRGMGSRAVAIFAAVSAVAVVMHPQQQWRFQATSLFAVWICAGAGAVLFIRQLRRPALAAVRIPVAIAAVAGLLAAHALATPDRGDVEKVAIRRSWAPRDTALAAAYLPFVRNDAVVGVVTTFGFSDLFAWTLRESCQCHADIDQAPLIATSTQAEAREAMAGWLATTRAGRIVFIDAPAPYPLPGAGDLKARLAGMDAMIAASGLFERETADIKVSPATIQIWRRKSGAPVPPPRRRFLFIGSLAVVLGGIAVGELLLARRRSGKFPLPRQPDRPPAK